MGSDPGQKPTIFIVDDETVLRDALRLVVQSMGLPVKCFSSASEFIEFINSDIITGPVCLITDVQMPEINGIELLEQLRALNKKFPVIITTGHGDTVLKHKAEKLGATFLEKPFRPAMLQDVITTVLRQNADEINKM